ncbi:SIR2 family protein [Bradyrhizobium sp. 138]|uniref:SIR2 family protein n=1 Tax=Bradyrhizobium sp. 138 TaxID=2782615 RepID=UPI001FF711E5|nr:SIR2 family protein [Bradyrhizobium sp. 138]MCK1738351.1 SIR2 family protein [Bradyrhizobium sp. 138]
MLVSIYDPVGQEVDHASAAHWPTVLRKPHGSVLPVKSFLVTGADYAEVLTEVDIQASVPDIIEERPNGRSFLFIGGRFNDRSFAIYGAPPPPPRPPCAADHQNDRLTSITRSLIRKHSRATNSAFWSSNT